MTSRERILAAWQGAPTDYVPLTTWCFGLPAPPELAWTRNGSPSQFWYSLRMEHIHTLPQPWTQADDFRRVRAWASLGVDDVLDVSVPWSIAPEVSWRDERETAGPGGKAGETLVRTYETPAGRLRHAVSRTAEYVAPGWVVQPDHVPLFEDYNIPRGVEHAVSSQADVPAVEHLFCPPDDTATDRFLQQMAGVSRFAAQHHVAVQAWAGFGMDGVVWLTGVQGAIMLAMDEPEAFDTLMRAIARTDFARIELAAAHPAVDAVVARGWYSSTDFWSPALFDRYVYPYIAEAAARTHRHGKTFVYTMTTGVAELGEHLVEAGVDVLYFVDPVQDSITLEAARQALGGKLTLVGGINSTALATDSPGRIRSAVRDAMATLKPTGRFILHPVDALFPDTPWEAVAELIKVWRDVR